MSMLRGIVKQVLSGDTIVIMGLDTSRGPPPEKQLTLAYLSAPRVGNRNQPDVPFAWAAREWLRNRVIAKEVSFSVDYANPQGRQFGTVLLNENGGVTDVGLAVVSEGWAHVQAPKPAEGAQSGPLLERVERLLAAEAMAKNHGIGQHNTAALPTATRVVDYAPDVPALLKALHGQRVTAVVEHLSSASSLRVLLLPGFQNVTLLLAGVLTPLIRRHPETGVEEAQPLAKEARQFSETRVLHRTVRVALEGVDKSGNLVGSVFHVSAEINLGVELLRAGFARVADWSLGMTSTAAQLRQAENAAKLERLRLWHAYTPPAAQEGMSEYQARVVEVLGADMLLVAPVLAPGSHSSASDERRVCLSLVRAPRCGNERSGGGEPWGFEAKEWMRRNAVGKKVRVVPEYKRRMEAREASSGAEGGAPTPAKPEVERVYAAVFVGERNLAAGLIGAGLAAVNSHARGEEASSFAEALHEAERLAKEGRLGAHSDKAPAGQQWGPSQDLTLPANKARASAFLPALQRDSRVRATVLHVVHGGRIKCLIPREGCVIAFALAGVRCPATARRDQPGSVSEPFADEAFAFARASLLQRDVELEVESLDKNGCFMGAIHLLGAEGRAPYAVQLLEAGLARRIPPAADRSRHSAALEAAERSARDARLNVWAGWTEAQPEAPPEEEPEPLGLPAAGSDASVLDALVKAALSRVQELSLHGTDVKDGATFYAHLCGPGDTTAADLRRVETALAAAPPVPSSTFAPKAGQAVAARFAADGRYYRAKVAAPPAAGQVEVMFVDYGNSQTCALSECRPLEPSVSLSAVPPLAVCCRLAYLVAPPTDDEVGTECALALSQAVLGQTVRARVEKRSPGEMHVTLLLASHSEGSSSSQPAEGEPSAPKSIVAGTLNAELVAEGLARVEKRPELRNAATGLSLDALRALQQKAKAERLGMWRHGDIEEDDCKEFGWTPKAPEPAWGKKK